MKRSVLLLFLATATADADSERLSRPWNAQPASTASTGASVRAGVGHIEDDPRELHTTAIIMMIARAHVRVMPALQLDLSLGGELGGDEFVLSSPAIAATWISQVDALHVAVRATASPAIRGGVTQLQPNMTSSLLAHDPLVGWSSAHTLAMQLSLQGGSSALWWGIAGSVIELIPTGLPRHQTLVRADVALAGPLGRCWSWALEVGATSDVFDEEYDEGTDLVPLWSAGVYHHRGELSIGLSTTGGWVGGARDDVLGPSVFVDLRGPL